MFPGYLLDMDMNLFAGPEVPTVSLAKLTSLLKSGDEDLWARSRWMFDGDFRFLDERLGY